MNTPKHSADAGAVQHLNPDELAKKPAYTNVIVVTGAVKTIYIGAQDDVDSSGAIVGKGDLKAQAEQVMQNVQVALAAAEAGLEHLIKWNVYLVQGQPLQPGFEVFQRVWGRRPNPPAVSMVFVAGLARPDFLLEIDAIAVVPQ
jgi:enamine deaminase RidA (YjgF/YER057c/UK114 family)